MSANLVPLAVFSYVSEAHIAKSYLESNGILSFVFDENLAYAAWHYTSAIGGVRLMVLEEDYHDAATLLQDVEDLKVEIAPYKNPIKKASFFQMVASVLVLIYTGAILPFNRKRKSKE